MPLMEGTRIRINPPRSEYNRLAPRDEASARRANGDCVRGYGAFPFARQTELHRRWKHRPAKRKARHAA
jgi:hypothetical protein